MKSVLEMSVEARTLLSSCTKVDLHRAMEATVTAGSMGLAARRVSRVSWGVKGVVEGV